MTSCAVDYNYHIKEICSKFTNVKSQENNYLEWNSSNISNYAAPIYLIDNLSFVEHLDIIVNTYIQSELSSYSNSVEVLLSELHKFRKHDFLAIQRYSDRTQEQTLNEDNDELLIYNWLYWYSCHYILSKSGHKKSKTALEVAIREKLYSLNAIVFMAMTRDIGIKGELFYYRQLRLVGELSCIEWMKDRLALSDESIEKKIQTLSS